MTLRQRIDGWLNPVMVKELRQAVRGRFIVTVISLSLLAQIVTVAGFMLTNALDAERVVVTPVGAETFTVLFFVLFTATVFFIPLYSGIRMAVERSDTNVDLLFVTTIKPRTIVIGKVLTTVVLTALIFFASLPFLVFSYALRGIDVLVVLFILGVAFGVVCSAAVVALFLGCVPASKPFRIVLGAVFLGLVSMTYAFLGAFVATMVTSNAASMLLDRTFWIGFAITMSIVLLVDAMLLIATTVIITPAAANRALPIRLMVTAVWTIALAAAVRLVFQLRDATPITVWAIAALALITIVLCSAAGEREQWGPRVARAIPRTAVKRALAFLFYSGAAGGVLWSIVMYALTIAVYDLVVAVRPARLVNRSELAPDVIVFVEAALCFIAYALTAVWLRRRFLRRVPARATWALALGIFLLAAVVPPLVFVSMSADATRLKETYDLVTILNPFPRLEGRAHVARAPLIVAWALVAFGASVSWIAAQWRMFRPLRAEQGDAGLELQEASAP